MFHFIKIIKFKKLKIFFRNMSDCSEDIENNQPVNMSYQLERCHNQPVNMSYQLERSHSVNTL